MENSVWLEWSHFSQRGGKESVLFFSPFLIIYVSVLWILDEKNIIPVSW